MHATPRVTADMTRPGGQDAQPDVLHAPAMAGATKVLERMSAQVQQLEIAMDLQVNFPRLLLQRGRGT